MSLRYDLDAVQLNRWQNAITDDGSVLLRPGIYIVTATENIYLGALVVPTGATDGQLIRQGERYTLENAIDGYEWHVLRATVNTTVTTFSRVIR